MTTTRNEAWTPFGHQPLAPAGSQQPEDAFMLPDNDNMDSFCDRVMGSTQAMPPPPPTAAPPSDVKASLADEAKRITSGARRAAYGTPEDNFARIARFWTGYMQNTGRDITVTAGDISPLMVLMKLARICETPDHWDSWVDAAGYILTGAEVNGVRAA